MKVFISHASSDKWAARKISEDLERLGAKTFLDEKDLRSGVSIDSSIASHLEESDHFLILLSPASIASHWVLVELGGAIALRKHLVPVLFYLGANDIPGPIQRFLARDINDLQKYYEELTTRSSTPMTIAGAAAPSANRSAVRRKANAAKTPALKVGDSVRLPTLKPKLDSDEESRFGWASSMDAYLGKTAKIVEIERLDGYSLHRLDIDERQYAWYGRWLERL